MIRISLSLLVAGSALLAAGGAVAAPVSLVVTGLTPQQIHDQVMVAADKVCSEAMRHHELDDADSQDQCVVDTVDATMKKLSAENPNLQLAASDTRK